MSSIRLARRVTNIRVSPSTLAAQKARNLKAEGRDIVDLTVGEPDFDTPDSVKECAIEAIRKGDTKYTPVNGTASLRKAIQHDYSARLGLDYPLDAFCVGGGAKQILFLALTATVEAGDEVIIPAPYWVSYPDMVMSSSPAARTWASSSRPMRSRPRSRPPRAGSCSTRLRTRREWPTPKPSCRRWAKS